MLLLFTGCNESTKRDIYFVLDAAGVLIPREAKIDMPLEKQKTEEAFSFQDYCKEEYDTIFLLYPYFNTEKDDFINLKMSDILRRKCDNNTFYTSFYQQRNSWGLLHNWNYWCLFWITGGGGALHLFYWPEIHNGQRKECPHLQRTVNVHTHLKTNKILQHKWGCLSQLHYLYKKHPGHNRPGCYVYHCICLISTSTTA